MVEAVNCDDWKQDVEPCRWSWWIGVRDIWWISIVFKVAK